MFRFFILLLAATQIVACIGTDTVDDFVEPELRVSSPPDTIGFGESFQFEANFLNNVGQPEDADVQWSSANTDVVTIDSDGLATGVSAGSTSITAEVDADGIIVTDEVAVTVGEETVVVVVDETRSGEIRTTSSYRLTGDFEVSEISGGVRIDIADNYRASTALPGLYVYLTNNPNTTNGAFEIGAVQTFNGAHFYEVQGVTIDQFDHLLYFCKPFNVKVGDGEYLEQ